MTVLERRDDVLEDGRLTRKARRLLLCRLHVRLGDARARDDQERDRKDAHRDHERRTRVAERRVLRDFANQQAEDHRRERCSNRVERAAELHELVALVTAAAERVEKRIGDEVQHAHRKARDERADHVDGEGADEPRKQLDRKPRETDRNRRERRELVALALQDEPARNAHEEIGEKVRKVAELAERVGRIELILRNNAHRAREIRHESYHEKQREHRDDGRNVSALLVLCFHLDNSF